MLYFLKARHFYRKKKYQDVVDPIEGYESIDVDESSTGGDNLINNPTASISSKRSDKLWGRDRGMEHTHMMLYGPYVMWL